MANKTIVITGASAGIGEGVAHRLARDGHRLVLAARQRGRLDAVAAEATRLGAAGTLVVETDVTRRTDIEQLSRAAIDAFGSYDVWINNAGRGITRSVQQLTDEDLDAIFAVNVKSVVYGMQVAVEHFKQRGSGQIINVSSFLGRVPLATFRSAYNAAKAAVNALTANLRMELRVSHPGIHVTLVEPGFFRRSSLPATRSAMRRASSTLTWLPQGRPAKLWRRPTVSRRVTRLSSPRPSSPWQPRSARRCALSLARTPSRLSRRDWASAVQNSTPGVSFRSPLLTRIETHRHRQ